LHIDPTRKLPPSPSARPRPPPRPPSAPDRPVPGPVSAPGGLARPLSWGPAPPRGCCRPLVPAG
ncbi:hypothetical protein KXV73_002443, partial [Aspergillus fumigatus]